MIFWSYKVMNSVVYGTELKWEKAKKIIFSLNWKRVIFLLFYIEVLVIGDILSEFQKNWTVDSPWKFNPKMALLSSIFTFDRSTTSPRQKVSCILGMPWDVFDHDQRDFWLWNSHRVKIDRWELEDVLMASWTFEKVLK